jgi:hypothetical protein
MSYFSQKIEITQTFQKLVLECLSNFYFWAKIAHLSLIFTPESFCKKASGKLICFPPLKLPFFPGAKSVLFVVSMTLQQKDLLFWDVKIGIAVYNDNVMCIMYL